MYTLYTRLLLHCSLWCLGARLFGVGAGFKKFLDGLSQDPFSMIRILRGARIGKTSGIQRVDALLLDSLNFLRERMALAVISSQCPAGSTPPHPA